MRLPQSICLAAASRTPGPMTNTDVHPNTMVQYVSECVCECV